MALRLEDINIRNFKSFRGVHQISGLDGHLTAIVGPNGSGKSNIIDSILFVLGFKARKMRHAVLKDLISTGCTECCVELAFNHFSISRSLSGRVDAQGNMKSCTSTYMIDGAEISAGEAIEFLKGRGIDLDNNRFLILQGEIEAISMMSPLELLDYVEDCIGSSSLKAPIEKLESGVRLRLEELEGLEGSLKFVESDYLFKKDRRDKRIDVLKHKGQALALKNKIVMCKAVICNRKHASLQHERVQAEDCLRVLCERGQRSASKIKELEKSCAALDIRFKEEALLQCRREHQRVVRENRAKEDRRSKLEKRIGKIKRDISDNEQMLDSWTQESALLMRSLSNNSDEIEAYESEIKEKLKELGRFDEVGTNENEKASLERTLLELLERRERLFSSDIKLLESKLSSLNETISRIRSSDGPDRSGLEREVSQLRSDIDSTLSEINKRRRRAEEFQRIEQAYRKEREVIESLRNVPGVFGLLKDLGTIERGYEEAVEASTKSLSSIVVDNTSTAEECVSIINRKRLNRTTFIILDKLPAPPNESLEKPVVARAAELLYKKISCDPRFTRCFYYALKDTLCVGTLEEAKALAFGRTRRRVVTLDGKLLEKSGVMSGGRVGKKPKSVAELETIYRNMNVLLETKMADLEQARALETQRRQLDTYVRQASDLSKEISRRTARVSRQELECLEDEIAKARKRIRDIESAQLPLRVVELRSEIKMLNEKVDILQKMNQDIKIKLGCSPSGSVEPLRRELQQCLLERDHVEIVPLPDPAVLDGLEKDYRACHEKLKSMQDEIGGIRSEMGEHYHQEAELKTRLEEISESLSECERTGRSCAARKREMAGEFLTVRGLLLQADGSVLEDLEEDASFAEELDEEELKARIREMSEKLKESKDTRNDDEAMDDFQTYELILSEYEHSRREYEELKGASECLEGRITAMRIELEGLKGQRQSRFMEGFGVINKNIKEIFNLITFGGNAELDLIDYLNPFADGVVLSIMPPKKAWKPISHLSGGEKTLSSISLIFALHKYKPSSFYIMDEIDAALDYRNVSIISQYLSSVDAQFIIISLRNDMFEAAKTLLGVYKNNDVSRAVVVDVDRLALM